MNKKSTCIIITIAVIVCIAVLGLGLGLGLKKRQSNEQTPDRIKVYLLGQKVSTNGDSLVFNKVSVTKSLQLHNETATSENGYYICIMGEISASNRKLYPERIFLSVEKTQVFVENNEPVFIKDLTQSVSTELRFDDEPGVINGDLCLVFEIDETTYQFLFENKERAERGLAWEVQGAVAGIRIFSCLYSDIEYK